MRASFLLSVIVLSLNSCCLSKKTTVEENYNKGNLELQEVYIQSEIPGDEGASPQTFLYMKFDQNEVIDVSFEKVRWEKGQVVMKKTGANHKIELINASNMPIDEITIYFSKKNVQFRQSVSPILTKEPIYRP